MKTLLTLLFALIGLSQAQTPAVEHHIVYHQEKEFAAWPANEGLWSWGDEILVGFNVADFKERNDTHSISGDMGVAFARSLDGGQTWTVERHANVQPPAKLASPSRHQPSPGGIDFTHPDFAMKLRGRFFFTSTDRGRTWQGAYRVPDFGQDMDARTSYVVTGKSACLFFIPCTVNDGRGTRIRSCAVETTDGGKSFHFLSWIGADPLDALGKKLSFDTKHVTSTMPSVVRMDDGRLVCAMRNRVDRVKWSAIEESTDGGRTWRSVTTLEKGSSNPVSLVRLGGERLAASMAIAALFPADSQPSSAKTVVALGAAKSPSAPTAANGTSATPAPPSAPMAASSSSTTSAPIRSRSSTSKRRSGGREPLLSHENDSRSPTAHPRHRTRGGFAQGFAAR